MALLSTNLFVGGLVAYIVVFLWIWLLVLWLFSIDRFRSVPFVWQKLPLLSPKTVFVFLISLFLISRWIWLCLSTYTTDAYSAFIFNRIALVLLFTSFSLIILFWAETLHMIWRDKGVKKKKEGFYKSIVTRMHLAFVIAFVATDNGAQKEDVLAYDINIILITSIFFLVCVGFALYGALLLFATRKISDLKKKAAFYAQIIVMTLVLIACFGLRFGLFLYRPITNQYLQQDAFETFAYYFPELVPVFMLSTIIIWSRRQHIYRQYLLHQRTAQSTKSKQTKSTDDDSAAQEIQLDTFSRKEEED